MSIQKTTESPEYEKRKLSKNEHTLLKLALQRPRFELVKEIAEELGVNYISLTRSAKHLVFKRDMLGTAFSPYRMNLDRYLVIFRLKREYEKMDAKQLLDMLPYNVWVKSITMATIPMGETYAYYLIPRGESIETVVDGLKKTDFIDKSSDIFVSRMNLTYFIRPDMDIYYKDPYGEPMSLDKVLTNIEFSGLLKADKSELDDPYPKPPNDFIDVVIMSMLEVNYVFSPKWLSSKGIMNLGIARSKYHYTKHIRDKYTLWAYLRRPLDPHANAMYMFVVRGREALDLGYTLSRTPYAYVLCDILDTCQITFWIRSDQVHLVNDFIGSFDIEIIKQSYREVLPEEEAGLIKRSLRGGFPFTNYSIKNRDWYGLDEAVDRYERNKLIIGKKLKKTKIWEVLWPQLPRKAVR